MTLVARVGVDSVGTVAGTMILGSPTVFVNLAPVVYVGSPVLPHEPCCCPVNCGCQEHCSSQVLTGSPTVFVNNIPSVRMGDMTLCGHPVMTGSPNVSFG